MPCLRAESAERTSISSRRGVHAAAALAAATMLALPVSADQSARQTPDPGRGAPSATFRTSVDLVSISAVVRDRRGKVIPNLKRADFEILDGGVRRQVVDMRADSNAPASVALLVDGSGSMRFDQVRSASRHISTNLLAGLNPSRDAAALLSFDTRLLTLCEFTRDFDRIRAGLDDVESFGATSLYDAVAGSAALVAERARNRRAVVVLTDGLDNASVYSPEQVAWIASTIDVPFYVFDISGRPEEDRGKNAPPPPLATLAQATGGDLFVANTPELMDAAIRRVNEELRHQYLIAFEGATGDGLRRLEIRTRKKDLRVQARAWYQAANN
jgi:VWFA-related protein